MIKQKHIFVICRDPLSTFRVQGRTTYPYLFQEIAGRSAQFLRAILLAGEMLKYESIDTGRTSLLKSTAPSLLMLKRSCKVMLLFNITKALTNGTFGTFINRDETTSTNESLLIEFPNVLLYLGKLGMCTTRMDRFKLLGHSFP